jgi:lysozyme
MAKHEGRVTRPDLSVPEGVVHVAYADPAHGWKIPTICSGHTHGVKRGDTATEAQCRQYLQEDVDKALWALFHLVTVPLTQGEIDAYTDFIFNLGEGKFANSTLRKKLNNGDHIGACNELLRWVHGNGKPMKGLINRRKDFHALCIRDL